MTRSTRHVDIVALLACALGVATGALAQQGPTVSDSWLDDTVVVGDPSMEQGEPPSTIPPAVPGFAGGLPLVGAPDDLPAGVVDTVYEYDLERGAVTRAFVPVVAPGEIENASADPEGEPPAVATAPGGRGGARNMSGYASVGDTTQFPFRRTVRIVSVYIDTGGTTRTYSCSGTLVDSRHVLTAGHCLYMHDDSNGNTINDWPVRVRVYPAVDDDDGSATSNWWCNTNSPNDGDCDEITAPFYDETDFPYGGARGTHAWAMSKWVDNEWHSRDVGWLRLDRPVGALTGWSSYGYSTKVCSWWTGASWWNDGYPSEPGVAPLDGRTMQQRSGSFDSCPLAKRKRIDSLSWGGSSGSAAVRSYNGVRTAFAVLSTSDRVSRTDFCRLTSGAFYGLRDEAIKAARPSGADLIPMTVRSSVSSIEAGDFVTGLTYRIHNYSESATFSGNVLVKVYLSTNRKITVNDTLIGSRNVNVSIPRMQTAFVNAAAPFPTIPQGTAPGQYFLGVILDVVDADTSNNNTVRWDSTPVTITAAPDLWAQSITVTPGQYLNGQTVPVDFSVKNIGNLGSGNWWGDFYASQDLALDATDVLLATGNAGDLAPGATFATNDTVPISGLAQGMWHMILAVDATNGDSDYANNVTVSSTPFEVVGPCDGDADGSNLVDVQDISFVIFRLGDTDPTGAPVPGDVDANGIVDVQDISYVIFRLGNDCNPF